MRIALVLMASSFILFGQTLPGRLDPTPAKPVIQKLVQPRHFLETVGKRGAILGTEDGTFEAWLNPIKLARDFRISVFFDGSLDPVELSDLAETVAVSPGRVTITHSHAAFTIRQTWVAAINEPVLLVLLESTPSDTHVTLRSAVVSRAEVVIKVSEPGEEVPLLIKPAPGDPAQLRRDRIDERVPKQ
jgi:hypothetical protein